MNKILLHLKSLWICCFGLLTIQLSHAQTNFTIAGHGARIFAPDVEMKHVLGRGLLFRIDWVRKTGNVASLAVTYDQFTLLEPGGSVNEEYFATLTAITYGRRTYFSSENRGGYVDIDFGPLFSTVEGSSDSKANSATGISISFSPGFGYAGKYFCAGIQGHVAPSIRGETYVGASINAGFHFGVKTTSKPKDKIN